MIEWPNQTTLFGAAHTAQGNTIVNHNTEFDGVVTLINHSIAQSILKDELGSSFRWTSLAIKVGGTSPIQLHERSFGMCAIALFAASPSTRFCALGVRLRLVSITWDPGLLLTPSAPTGRKTKVIPCLWSLTLTLSMRIAPNGIGSDFWN